MKKMLNQQRSATAPQDKGLIGPELPCRALSGTVIPLYTATFLLPTAVILLSQTAAFLLTDAIHRTRAAIVCQQAPGICKGLRDLEGDLSVGEIAGHQQLFSLEAPGVDEQLLTVL